MAAPPDHPLVIGYSYGAASSADDLLSRVTSLKINGEGSNLADYTYLGLTALVKSSYPQPGVNLSYIKTAGAPVGDAGDPPNERGSREAATASTFRLAEVRDSADNVVATYAYDGIFRRITKTIGAVVRHYYCNDQWSRADWREARQIFSERKPAGCWSREAATASTLAIEERLDSDTDADRQYAWGTQYRNELILRDRDTTGNGALDERLYATHDALGSCTAVLDTSGAVQERYGYSAFGVRRIMQADFSARASSSFAWDFAFHGEFLDIETGYINYGYRFYLSFVGKWINRDPISEDGGNNLYGFVRNDGVNGLDVFGLRECPECPSGAKKRPIPSTDKCNYEYRTTKQGKRGKPNGCGAAGKAPVPDFKGTFLPACQIHDNCWGTCAADKETCDTEFKDNLLAACKGVSPFLKGACINAALGYWAAVANLSGTNFEDAQDEACKWDPCCV